MFKVIETDEEFESALAAGLLWRNTSAQWPRHMAGWTPCEPEAHQHARMRWEEAKDNKRVRRRMAYLPEDFAVFVEEEDDSL